MIYWRQSHRKTCQCIYVNHNVIETLVPRLFPAAKMMEFHHSLPKPRVEARKRFFDRKYSCFTLKVFQELFSFTLSLIVLIVFAFNVGDVHGGRHDRSISFDRQSALAFEKWYVWVWVGCWVFGLFPSRLQTVSSRERRASSNIIINNKFKLK